MSLNFLQQNWILQVLKKTNRPMFEEEFIDMRLVRQGKDFNTLKKDVHNYLKELALQHKVALSFRARCPYCDARQEQTGGQVICVQNKTNHTVGLVLFIGQNNYMKLRFQCLNPHCKRRYTGQDVVNNPNNLLYTAKYIDPSERNKYFFVS